MRAVRVSRQLLLIHRQFKPSALATSLRFKSDKPNDPTLDDNKLKSDLEELTKKLDDNMQKKPEEMEQELDEKFMNFRRMREAS